MESDRIRGNTVTHQLEVDIKVSDSEHCEQSRVSLPPIKAKQAIKLRLLSMAICLTVALIALGIVSALLIDARYQVRNLKLEGSSRQECESQIEELRTDMIAKQKEWDRKEKKYVDELETLQSMLQLEKNTNKTNQEALEKNFAKQEIQMTVGNQFLEQQVQALQTSLDSEMNKNRDLQTKEIQIQQLNQNIEKQMADSRRAQEEKFLSEKENWESQLKTAQIRILQLESELRSEQEFRIKQSRDLEIDMNGMKDELSDNQNRLKMKDIEIQQLNEVVHRIKGEKEMLETELRSYIHSLILEALRRGLRGEHSEATHAVQFWMKNYGHFFWIQEYDYAVRAEYAGRDTAFHTLLQDIREPIFGRHISDYFHSQELNFLAMMLMNSLHNRPASNLATFSEIVGQQCSGISTEKVSYTHKDIEILEEVKTILLNRIEDFEYKENHSCE